jgi:hypothetical protein
MRVALFALLVAGCYSPTIKDGQFLCADGKTCPSGFVCKCGGCFLPSSTCSDGGLPGGDMSMGDGSMATHDDGCSNGGHRAAGDPNLPDVAVCPAAWALKGLANTQGQTPCGRMPGPNGKNGSNVDCSAQDNCAAGWHLCATEAELQGKGFTAAMCSALTGFFATLQGGSVPMSGGVPTGPPQCVSPMDHFVFGCGSTGMMADLCNVIDKVLLDNPSTGQDECSSSTNGAFTCVGTNMTTPETNVVQKPMLAGGGVICCRN